MIGTRIRMDIRAKGIDFEFFFLGTDVCSYRRIISTEIRRRQIVWVWYHGNGNADHRNSHFDKNTFSGLHGWPFPGRCQWSTSEVLTGYKKTKKGVVHILHTVENESLQKSNFLQRQLLVCVRLQKRKHCGTNQSLTPKFINSSECECSFSDDFTWFCHFGIFVLS